MVAIYKITSPTGKVYIGQTINYQSRISRYINLDAKVKKQRWIYSSLAKYGPKNHRFEIVCELPSDVSKDVLNEYEELHIRCYKDCGVELMNLTGGGQSNKELSKETREKLRLSATGKQYWLGRKHTQETKDKIRKANTGAVFSEIRLKRMSESQKGKCHTKGRKMTPEQIAAMKKRLTGRSNIANSGERNPTGKLKEKDVHEIRRIWASDSDLSQEKLGKIYGVSQASIRNIIIGKTWKYV